MNKLNVLLYDGDCGFCNYWVRWILKRDKQDVFQFAALQGEFGQKFLQENNYDQKVFDTVILIRGKQHLRKLDAVAAVGGELGGIYHLLRLLRFIPRRLGDRLYDLVAANRKRLAPARCVIPTAAERKKFIS